MSIFTFGQSVGKRTTVTANFPGATWDTRTPAEAGMSSSALDDLFATVGGSGFVVRDGYQVYTWGSPNTKVDWASAAKPVSTTMLLFAIEEALVADIDALVDDYWVLTGDDTSMTLAHAASMTGGYMRPEAPGAAFSYNDYAVNLFKKTVFDEIFAEASPNTAALNANRLGALGFQDGSLYSGRGGYGVTTSMRDMARIGWFWLNRGNWDGDQLISASLFDSVNQNLVADDLPISSGADSSDYLSVGSFGGDSNQSSFGPGIYGWGWWFNDLVAETANRAWPAIANDMYMAQGHFGTETLVVVPSLGLVVATDGNMGNFDPGNASATMNTRMGLIAATVP